MPCAHVPGRIPIHQLPGFPFIGRAPYIVVKRRQTLAAGKNDIALHEFDFRIGTFFPTGIIRHHFPFHAIGAAPCVTINSQGTRATCNDVELTIEQTTARHGALTPGGGFKNALPFHIRMGCRHRLRTRSVPGFISGRFYRPTACRQHQQLNNDDDRFVCDRRFHEWRTH